VWLLSGLIETSERTDLNEINNNFFAKRIARWRQLDHRPGQDG
jgi:hypothetical protein